MTNGSGDRARTVSSNEASGPWNPWRVHLARYEDAAARLGLVRGDARAVPLRDRRGAHRRLAAWCDADRAVTRYVLTGATPGRDATCRQDTRPFGEGAGARSGAEAISPRLLGR